MQTVLPASYVATLLHGLPLGKLRGLGGKFGVVVQEQLGIATAGACSDVAAGVIAVSGVKQAVAADSRLTAVCMGNVHGGARARLYPAVHLQVA